MKNAVLLLLMISFFATAQYPGPANTAGTTAIAKDSSILINWAQNVIIFNPGKEDTAAASSVDVSYGTEFAALFEAEGNSTDVVSLGDGGVIVLGFEYPIRNGEGYDFAVFENSFSHEYLEFAHVEVSTDGVKFVRIPSVSLIDPSSQTATYANSDPTQVHNLAGKYIQGFGTPFNLDDILDSVGVNLDSINYVRIIDVVGTINPVFGSFDALGNIINDPYPSAFESGGFDLDAVGVIHENRPDLGQIERKMEYTIYPNPSENYFSINGLVQGTFTLYSMDGKIVCAGDVVGKTTVNMNDLGICKGVYLIEIKGVNEQIEIQKVIFQ